MSNIYEGTSLIITVSYMKNFATVRSNVLHAKRGPYFGLHIISYTQKIIPQMGTTGRYSVTEHMFINR